MNIPEKPDYGEPWEKSHEMIFDRDGDYVAEFQPPFRCGMKDAERAVACVNAMAGRPDPAAAMARLAQLEWVLVTERLPELDDANEFEDVEWSDGKDIWQGNYRNEDNATHWRRITLP